MIGFSLALPLAMLAARRARLLPLWPAVAIAVTVIGIRAIPGGYGLLLFSAALAALTSVLHRMEGGGAARPVGDARAVPTVAGG